MSWLFLALQEDLQMAPGPSAPNHNAKPPPLDLRVCLVLDNGAPAFLRFTCRFGHPVERVWAALTNPVELAVWYPTRVELEARQGGRISFAFPGADPFFGEVIDATPPRLLAFTTLDDTLTWRLAEVIGGCELMLENTLPHPEHAPYTAAGFDVNLRQLATLLDHGAKAVTRHEMPPPPDLVDYYRTALEHDHSS
jgi:uncharacterized protein YndB with AHSA1/START domain